MSPGYWSSTSIRRATGSTRTRRSITSASPLCFASWVLRLAWTASPPPPERSADMRIRLALFVVVSLLPAVDPSPLLAQTAGIREVTATDRNVIPLNTRLRYTTMIVLPEGDEILDVICGDRDFWVVSAVQNVAHVKPAKADAETNLNLVTARGTIYSFLLKEKTGAGQPDLKIYVNASEAAPNGRPKYYSAADVE